jgi:hypothetical protein
MQYAIIKVVNGNYEVAVETNDEKQANVNFHQLCTTLWNAEDVSQAFVAIVDQRLSILKSETIYHATEAAE